MKKFTLLTLVSATLVSIVSMASLVVKVSPAQALCVTPEEAGSWVNSVPNTRSITQINVRFQCQDQVINGQLYPPVSPYYLRLFGACSPTDCDWGEIGATRDSAGWIRTTIHQGFATRYVWVKAYTGYADDWLRVYIWTDFRASNRTDYASDEWFNRR